MDLCCIYVKFFDRSKAYVRKELALSRKNRSYQARFKILSSLNEALDMSFPTKSSEVLMGEKILKHGKGGLF